MFERFYLTTKGANLLAKAQAGVTLEYTRMRIGDGVLPTGQSITALTDLIAPIKSFGISKLSTDGDKALVTIMFTNSGIGQAFWWREVGLYANDPIEGEILYAYANAGAYADHVPGSGTTAVSFTFSMQAVVGNASHVTTIINPSAEFLTRADLVDYAKSADLAALQNGINGVITAQNDQMQQQINAQNQAVTDQLAAQDQRVNDALAAKADRATEIPVTIPASAWQGSAAPYTATITVAGITATAKGEIGVTSSATVAQREAARAAMIAPTGTGTGKVFLVADGDKPTIDLPAVVTVLG